MRISDWSSDVCSSDLAANTCMALSLLRCCDRSSWHSTTNPVGKCVMRTAESVLLMCCPPAPLARKVSMRKSDELMTISLRSEEHTSELQSLMRISYAVFCLKKKTHTNIYMYNQKA